MDSEVKIICLTPVKNEEWILETFLRCASVWADHIIVADQGSTDRSREIARAFPKVILIENGSQSFNESARQKLLIGAAREIECQKRILIALDADEILAGDLGALRSKALLELSPGTSLSFRWNNLMNEGANYWTSPRPMLFGYIDDGVEHTGVVIHSRRIPPVKGSPVFHVEACPIFHLHLIDGNRMRSKRRWYHCFESLQFPGKSPIDIYRRYHHMDVIRPGQMKALDPAEVSVYLNKGIEPFRHVKESVYWWDIEVAAWLRAYGEKSFRTLDIWDADWGKVGALSAAGAPIRDPRDFLDKALLSYLRATQRYYTTRMISGVDRLLKKLGL